MTEEMDEAMRMHIEKIRKQCEDHIKVLKIVRRLGTKYPDLMRLILINSSLWFPPIYFPEQ